MLNEMHHLCSKISYPNTFLHLNAKAQFNHTMSKVDYFDVNKCKLIPFIFVSIESNTNNDEGET